MKFLNEVKNDSKEYLFLVSIFYLIGILFFMLLTSGGSFHSFFRYTLASPFFFIALLILLDYIGSRSIKPFIVVFFVSTVLLTLFLNLTEYGGARLQFSYLGLYMYIATGLFLLVKRILPLKIQIVISLMIILFNMIWNTYLLNVFFSNGWIFT